MYRESGKATQKGIREIFAAVSPTREAREVILYLMQEGYPVYLISGAIDMYVEEIAGKLGVSGFYANSSLKFDEQGMVEKIHYRDNQGSVKVEQLRDLVKRLGTDTHRVAFVGDSENDIEAFKETGHGVAFCPVSDELNEAAWKRIDSLRELTRIL